MRAAASAPRRPATAFASLRSPQATARKHFINTHAPAHFAAEAISDKLYINICGSSEPRSSPPPHSGGLQLAEARFVLRRRRTAPHGLENVKNDKKMHVFCWMLQLFVLLLDQAIRRKRRESRCCSVNLRNLPSNGNKRMSRRVVNHAPIGSTS